MNEDLPEWWLRGPLTNTAPLLQPAAHALLQAQMEIEQLMAGYPDGLIWKRPAGLASPGFHLLHMRGVLDRMRTYAQGKELSGEQFDYLKDEQKEHRVSAMELVGGLKAEIGRMLHFMSGTPESALPERRTVGRKKLPSTVAGLLFHAAEHTMRHLGQLLVTVKVLEAGERVK